MTRKAFDLRHGFYLEKLHKQFITYDNDEPNGNEFIISFPKDNCFRHGVRVSKLDRLCKQIENSKSDEYNIIGGRWKPPLLYLEKENKNIWERIIRNELSQDLIVDEIVLFFNIPFEIGQVCTPKGAASQKQCIFCREELRESDARIVLLDKRFHYKCREEFYQKCERVWGKYNNVILKEML